MEKTSLLAPATAIRIVWTCTEAFSKRRSSQPSVLIEEALQDIKELAEEDEKMYILRVKFAMSASLRSIHTIYKCRNLNFDENEKLRAASLEYVKENIEFGTKLRDFSKALPGMVIGGAGGYKVAQAFTFPDFSLAIIAVLGILAGFLVNWKFIAWRTEKNKEIYVQQDYDRNLYYEQYLNKVAEILESLYKGVNQIHKNFFGGYYPVEEEAVSVVNDIIVTEARPRHCDYFHEHMREGIITPKLWPLCETGVEKAVKECMYWKEKE
jgi:hypothetical protein